MPQLTLGLDIGPTSIGWALVDEKNKSIKATGVRIFPEGVDRDQQGGEKSKSQTRRDARNMRRQITRRAQRKKQLRQELVRLGLLPPRNDREAWDNLFAQNPYQLRRRALDEKLHPHEIGRVFLHLAQRRGFPTNLKDDKKEKKETIQEMNALQQAIKESHCRTLGEYLARLSDNFDHATSWDEDKIRGRHTRRDMYETEFEEIWEAQRAHHPDLFTEKLKYGSQGKQDYPKVPDQLPKYRSLLDEYGIHGLLFFQRRMYWPRSVIGRCELEPKQKRCPRADRKAQRFRILQEVNNLRFLDPSTGKEHTLEPDKRSQLVDYLWAGKQRTFDQIRKKLDLSESVRFNLERGERGKLKGNETDALLSAKRGIGKRWKDIPEDTKDQILKVLIEEDREDYALKKLTQQCGLSEDEAHRALSVNLSEGYMNFSRLAIENLLPHLEKGMLLMAEDEQNSALHAAGYLRPDEREIRQSTFLPPSPDLPNPIVRQALVEVRKVVNAVIREYGRPDRIHVELAREAKKSFQERQEIRFTQARRRRERENAKQEIEQYDVRIKPTRTTVSRYLLWKEQSEFCVYCGKKISQAQLFNGDADLDHILPRWRSLDDSLANKVVCHRKCNAQKGDRTPREWLEDEEPQRYEKVIQVSRKLPYNKHRKFQQRDIQLDEFVQRQLRDTAYISRCVTQYLQRLGVRVACPRGQMTSDLRHWWGLNNILDPQQRGRKNREDHRHHAVDALVVALTNEKRLFRLANELGRHMPPPWQKFRDQAQASIQEIQVSYRVLRRLHGALHEATLYGPTEKNHLREVADNERPWAKNWIEDEKTFVRRKPVTELTNTKHLDKVRDKAIRDILAEHLSKQGIDPDKSQKIPGTAFKGANAPNMPSGVPIKKVRMLEESNTFRAVSDRRSFQYVKPGNNHHIVYQAQSEGGSEKWTGEVVTMWEAALRGRNGKPLVDMSDKDSARFVMSLSIGEMFQMDDEDGNPLLCVVRKIDQRSKRLFYKLHTDARETAEINKDNLYLSPENLRKRNACKVTVDPLGRIRRAND